jgi:hypothetical protein
LIGIALDVGGAKKLSERSISCPFVDFLTAYIHHQILNLM